MLIWFGSIKQASGTSMLCLIEYTTKWTPYGTSSKNSFTIKKNTGFFFPLFIAGKRYPTIIKNRIKKKQTNKRKT